MGCGSGRCGSTNKDSSPSGCGSSGSCASGGCNRLNTHDWLSDITEPQASRFDIVEVSFKNGARKEFYRNPMPNECLTGDHVAVETKMGHDIGKISLSGELVRLQMRKKNIKENNDIPKILRKATERDMHIAETAWSMEYNTMLMARVASRDLRLDMKIGDVEYQGDGRKATFYYIAPGRVDFRELIKIFAHEFQVKIEMRQIGNRFEASRIGGIGSCGRELCCSTWMTKFKPVNTSAARYQNLAINQAKLSGQCGRLKCCLNFELDTYVDALQDFPKNLDFLKTKEGNHRHFKTNIFKKELWYSTPDAPPVCIPLERVKEVLAMNKKGEFPETLAIKTYDLIEEPKGFGDHEFEQFDLPSLPKENRRKNRNRNNKSKDKRTDRQPTENRKKDNSVDKQGENKPKRDNSKPQNRNNRKPNPNPNANKPKNEGEKGQDLKNEQQNKPKNPANKPPQAKKEGNAENGEQKRPQSNRNNRNRNRNRNQNRKNNGDNNGGNKGGDNNKKDE